MGNCAASKLAGGEEEVVTLCRERKRLLKSAVENRYVLAQAHAKYVHALRAVAAAINLFVTRHSTPTPILITLPPPSPPSSSSDPSFLQQTPTDDAKAEAAGAYRTSLSSSSSSSSCGGEMSGNGGELGCGYLFAGRVEVPASPMESFGWDFFNPFEGVRAAEEAVMLAGLGRSSDEELRAVREEEGIPELEDEEEEKGDGDGKVVALGGGSGAELAKLDEESGGEKGLTVVGSPGKERELLEALRAVEDHFVRAYDSGTDVTRMLEATHISPVPHPDVCDAKENPSKFMQAITWHRTSSARSSSAASFLASSSRSTSYAESKGDLFDEVGGMESGTHSQTLGRLYAWEKKLYEEVKAGDDTRRMYERKCSHLRGRNSKGQDSQCTDKTRAVAKDLYTRIWVAIRSAETISAKIQRLRDDELQPQLVELLQGLKNTWKVMLESHDTQNQIMCEVKSFTCPPHGKFCNEDHRFATLQLDAELQNWRSCFVSYIAAQRGYVEALEGWLSKFLVPEFELFSKGSPSGPRYGPGAPPLFLMCHDWLVALRRLPDKSVPYALKTFSRDVRLLWIKQGEEQQQKRKVDGLAKELDRKLLALEKAERRMLESKLSQKADELNVRQQVEHLAGRKEMLDILRKRLDVEKTKHQDCMKEKQHVTLNGFKTGFTNVFESLTVFSKGSLKMYDDLLNYDEKAKARIETPCIEDSETEACLQSDLMEEQKL